MNSNRYCVIMCGGIGSRFWPYSRENKPKQFIDFLGTGRSLLQMSVDRVRGIVPDENIVVVTNAAYLDLIREQCPELLVENILLEPARRNTAPCIAWAASHIFKKTPDASMIVSPSDHIITDLRSFERIVLDGFDFVENNDALLTLGINPTRPETGYGYIKFDSPVEKDIFKVERFAENRILIRLVNFSRTARSFGMREFSCGGLKRFSSNSINMPRMSWLLSIPRRLLIISTRYSRIVNLSLSTMP